MRSLGIPIICLHLDKKKIFDLTLAIFFVVSIIFHLSWLIFAVLCILSSKDWKE